MAVFSSFLCPRKAEYKAASGTDDATSLSDGPELSYLKVEHFTPEGSVTARNNTGTPCSTKCCIVSLTLLVSFALNVVISVYLWKKSGSPGLNRATQPYSDALVSAVHEDSVCTVCSSLGIRPESSTSVEFIDLSVHYLSEWTYICCLHNVAGLSRLVYLFSDRFDLAPPLKKATTNIPTKDKRSGVHFYIESQALKSNPPKLSWSEEYGFGSAYNSDDVTIDGNQLLIPRSGLYHVYSFITFKTEQPRLRPDNVIHTINRKNKHLPELGSSVILIDKTTLPEVSERFMTSFLSATVRLRKDDQIFVQVSNLSYVYRFAPSNFFGLYFVGE